MKKVILVLAMAATGYAANAQVSGQSKWDETKAGNDRGEPTAEAGFR